MGGWTGHAGPAPDPVASLRTGTAETPAVPELRSLTVQARMWTVMGSGVLGMVRTSCIYIYGEYPFPFRFSSPEWTNFSNLALSAHLACPLARFRALFQLSTAL